MIIKYQDFLTENKLPKPEDYKITNYEWSQGKLNCFQHVSITGGNLQKIPFDFGKIDGYFFCQFNEITSLLGCPNEITGSFNCAENRITSLLGCPEIVGDVFNCGENKYLTSLEHCPKRVGTYFLCETSSVKSIEDYPRCIIGDNFNNKYLDKYHFSEILEIVKENEEKFIPLLDNKIAFHQMVMRLNPDLIQYYETITPPSKKSILYNI